MTYQFDSIQLRECIVSGSVEFQASQYSDNHPKPYNTVTNEVHIFWKSLEFTHFDTDAVLRKNWPKDIDINFAGMIAMAGFGSDKFRSLIEYKIEKYIEYKCLSGEY